MVSGLIALPAIFVIGTVPEPERKQRIAHGAIRVNQVDHDKLPGAGARLSRFTFIIFPASQFSNFLFSPFASLSPLIRLALSRGGWGYRVQLLTSAAVPGAGRPGCRRRDGV